VSSGSEVLTLNGHAGIISGVAFSPDGRRLASASNDQTVRVWEADSGKEFRTIRGHTNGVESLAFSPDGRLLASSGRDLTVRVWEVDSGREVLKLKGRNVTFSPDGRRLASADGQTVRVWEADSGREVPWLKSPRGTFGSLAFSPNCQRLAGANGRTVQIWEADSGREVLTLKGHSDSVLGVAFSPDGKRLASASADRTVRLWEADTGREILMLKRHSGAVHDVAFGRDGQRLASASADGTVRVWETTPVTPELRERREVVRLVRFLVSEYLVREDVIAQLQGDRCLSAPMRRHALTLVKDWKDWPDRSPLTGSTPTWEIAKHQGATPARYRAALRWAEEACRRAPDYVPYLSDLGLAQYRNGRYAQAVASLTQAAQRYAKDNRGPIPRDLPILAMAHHQLGHKEEAAKAMARLRAVMQDPRWGQFPQYRAFLREAEELLGGKPANGKMPYADP
jgi:dipeptidyl aminopeptidase/acylaminoacyl peptidase